MTDTCKLTRVADKLDLHIQQFDEFKVKDQLRWKDLLAAQEKLLTCQQRNTEDIEKLVASTQNVVDAWKAANGAVKVAGALGKFVKWLSSLAVVGVGIVWVIAKIDPHFFKGV